MGKYMCTPFLKWPGGKRWLIERYSDLFPVEYNCYLEPFLGSGAVFFKIMPKKAIISDINVNLINTYVAIKKDWERVEGLLCYHHKNHTKEYYYKIRSQKYNDLFRRAAQFIYLNRTCWNGLYRVNLKGIFNVPIGTKTNVLLESDNFYEVAKILKRTVITKSNYTDIIEKAQINDFIFVDPPYVVNHNKNGFIKYNEHLFSWNDQVKLSQCLKRAKARGVKIIATNACHDSVLRLYKNDFEVKRISRKSTMAADSKSRKEYEEIIIRSNI
jgi:DNA adenine methylase